MPLRARPACQEHSTLAPNPARVTTPPPELARRLALVAGLALGACDGGELVSDVGRHDGGTSGIQDARPAVEDGRATGDTGTFPADSGPTDSGPTDAGLATDAGRRVPRDAGPHEPNPTLADLPANTALDLGPYECEERVPQMSRRCWTIVDYSRINYDPYNHRVLLFGGGHAATGRTDVDVLDPDTLEWESMYPSMSCEEVMAENIDPRGFHRATGHPVARHTYDQNVITEVDGVGRFFMLSAEGNAGVCHGYSAPIRGAAYLDLTPDNTTWGYSEELPMPWHIATAAEFDPPSGMVIVMGSARGAGEGGMWVFDPDRLEVVTFVDEVQYSGSDNVLVYFPPTQTHYFITREEPNTVWELDLDREGWTGSENTVVETSGTPASGRNGFAYDERHEVIGGGIRDGRFFAYDPVSATWSSEEMNVRSEDGATPGTVVHHHVDYDPVNNVYFFIADGSQGRRTWAYRYRD